MCIVYVAAAFPVEMFTLHTYIFIVSIHRFLYIYVYRYLCYIIVTFTYYMAVRLNRYLRPFLQQCAVASHSETIRDDDTLICV